MKLILIALLFTLCGCEHVEPKESKRPDITLKWGNLEYVVDEGTGVVYILYTCGNAGGITVAYNADGTVMKREDLYEQTEKR